VKWFDLSLAAVRYGLAGEPMPSTESKVLDNYKSLLIPRTAQYDLISKSCGKLGTHSNLTADHKRWKSVRDTIQTSVHRVNWLTLRRGNNQMQNVWTCKWTPSAPAPAAVAGQ
jgi:hypothetical protein